MKSISILSQLAVFFGLSLGLMSSAFADDPQAAIKPKSNEAAYNFEGAGSNSQLGEVCVCNTSPTDRNAPPKSTMLHADSSKPGDQVNQGADGN